MAIVGVTASVEAMRAEGEKYSDGQRMEWQFRDGKTWPEWRMRKEREDTAIVEMKQAIDYGPMLSLVVMPELCLKCVLKLLTLGFGDSCPLLSSSRAASLSLNTQNCSNVRLGVARRPSDNL